MQNQYVGDIGDFGKFGLLRALLGDDSSRLGVIWYLVPGDGGIHNGQHVSYLQNPGGKLRECDPELFDCLASLVHGGQRNVLAIEEAGILPADTVFYRDVLSFRPTAPQADKARERAAWVSNAVAATAACDMVFADPDNGIESASTRMLSSQGCKYAYFDDLRQIVARQQSLVVYHHLDRSGTTAEQAGRRLHQIRDELGTELVVALKFNRISPRFYFVVAAEVHESALSKRIEDFVSGPWGKHFKLIS